MNEAQKLDDKYHFKLYRRYPITLVRGHGSHVWDIDGKEYIDALAGIAVNNVGHTHPKVTKALHDQIDQLVHVSNFYTTEPQSMLAKRLVELSDLDRVFFCNSGTESIEGAIKLARRYGHQNGKSGSIISMEGCFHGRTLAAIATGKAKYQEGFEPIPEGFEQVPFNDFDAIKKTANDQTVAIIVEPVQGEGGVNVANKEFLQQVRGFCTEHNILLIFDEVQCGVGRTGYFFAYENFGVVPDILTLAKGLGGGVPIGAVLAKESVANALSYGTHGTTFGGNPLACRSALATIDAIHEENMLEMSRENGQWLRNQLVEAAKDIPSIKEIRGLGLMIGVEIDHPCADEVRFMMEHGVLANCASGNVIRLVPPLNISREDLTIVLQTIIDALKEK